MSTGLVGASACQPTRRLDRDELTQRFEQLEPGWPQALVEQNVRQTQLQCDGAADAFTSGQEQLAAYFGSQIETSRHTADTEPLYDFAVELRKLRRQVAIGCPDVLGELNAAIRRHG